MMLISRIEKIDEEIFQAFQRLIPQLTEKVAPPTRAELEALIQFDGSFLLSARSVMDGPILGVATLSLVCAPTGIHARLEDVVVDKSARGMGFGAALTEEAIRLARKKGAKYLALTSNPRREAANRLYQKMGFHRWETNVYRFDLQP